MNDGQVAFDHVHLTSKDPSRSARWYVEMFGGAIISESEARGAPQIVVDINGVRMIVRGQRPGEEPRENSPLKQFAGFVSHDQWGADHFGFKVTGDFLGYCAGIKKKGVAFTVEPFEIRPGVHIAFITGPDDETIELVEANPQ